MDLSIFFHPLDTFPIPSSLPGTVAGTLQAYVDAFPNWREADMVLVGSRECRAAGQHSRIHEAADRVREQLYGLSIPHEHMRVVDLGNLQERDTMEGYHEALAYVLHTLIQAGKTVLILGGTQDIVWGQYLAYEELERDLHYVQVDSRLDMDDSEVRLDPTSYNHKIFTYTPNYLRHFTNLGHQRYLVPPDRVQALKEMNFHAVRYGELHHQIKEAEPFLREADLLTFDLSCVRHAEAPAATAPSPGGFSAMEACQLLRYAGLGYRMSSLSFCEWDPQEDLHDQTSALVALMVWYFIEGYYSRPDDRPRADRANLRQYTVQLHASINHINFYKHPLTHRWWMEVPHPDSLGQRHPAPGLLVPCSERDYQLARQDDIPDLWWLMYNKMG